MGKSYQVCKCKLPALLPSAQQRCRFDDNHALSARIAAHVNDHAAALDVGDINRLLGHPQQLAMTQLWAQANPIASPAGLEGLSSLQVLSLAGTKIGSLAQLELLRPVTTRVDRPGRRLS